MPSATSTASDSGRLAGAVTVLSLVVFAVSACRPSCGFIYNIAVIIAPNMTPKKPIIIANFIHFTCS